MEGQISGQSAVRTSLARANSVLLIQSLGLGNFAIQPDELVMEAEVDDWSESILAQLQSDEGNFKRNSVRENKH